MFSREDFGIREIDIEPQLDCGKILIPRISEYAGVLLVQALRDLPVKMRLGPSNEIYQKEPDSDDGTLELPRPETYSESREQDNASATPRVGAESLPITSEDTIPQFPSFSVMDTLLASATLRSRVVEAEESDEYKRIVENLKQEIRYKAFHKGASGVIRFKVELTSLKSQSHYRVLATGVAIRTEHEDPFEFSEVVNQDASFEIDAPEPDFPTA